MTPTNVFLIPLPSGFPNAGKAVVDLCRQVNGSFYVDPCTTISGRARWRLWVRTRVAA